MSTGYVPDGDFIAVIGMAVRVPGAPDIHAYWDNLVKGVDSVSAAPRSWPAPKGVLEDHDLFDAEFFGFSPKEAERTDPQQRLFLECAWQALEHAGYGDSAGRPVTGVYAGASTSRYMFDVLASPRHRDLLDDSQLLIGCDKDYLATRTSHKLDLRGPSVTVQTACSTSLVAIHLACQALLAGECDMALAGGVAVREAGGIGGASTRPDGMVSPEGRCRAFDAGATGMVNGDGLGLVVLRRLDDALRDGDTVYAIVRGSAINNDGALKAGFTAPSIQGQARVIRAAHAAAQVDPATIGYIEAHGTGTRLGDPIEVAALAEAVTGVGPGDHCALGSVKTNIGHLDVAAGVVSFIKAVLSLMHGVIPPTLHFERPNPELRLDATPFFVNRKALPWTPANGVRRAGVSSFGIGGTNAHVVLEEPPPPEPPSPARPWQLIPVSARTAAARDRALTALGDAVRDMDASRFADAAYTMQTGRHEFDHRGFVVARSGAEAAAEIAAGGGRVRTGRAAAPPPVAFMFSGQGTQYAGMAAGLYAAEPVFREELDACLELIAAHGPDTDLRGALGLGGPGGDAAPALELTSTIQPALFAIEYALARLWASWGIEPAVLIGHSVGELAAACVAGVMSREDAVRLVLARGKAMAASRPGAMTAVFLPEEQVITDLPDGVEIAAVNAAAQTVLAGETAAIAALEERYARRGIPHRRLRTRHAFHTAAMDRAAETVAKTAASMTLSPPERPVISNVTGLPLTAQEATDPSYWGRQLRATVRFAAGLDSVAAQGARLLIEAGPGHTLCDLAAAAPGGAFAAAVPSLPGPGDGREDLEVMLGSLGRLWLHGLPVRWTGLHRSQRRRRVAMPTYPFERRRYTIAAAQDLPDGRPVAAPGSTPPATAGDPGGRNGGEPAAGRRGFSETEQVIAEVWERLLGIGEVGKDESFFDIGGHSLLGMQVLDELSRRFQVELPLAAFYENPTIAELALLIEETIISTLETPGRSADALREAEA